MKYTNNKIHTHYKYFSNKHLKYITQSRSFRKRLLHFDYLLLNYLKLIVFTIVQFIFYI